MRKGNINSNIRDPLFVHKYKRKNKQLHTNNFIQNIIIWLTIHKDTVSNTALQQTGIQTCASIFSMTVIFQYFLTAVKLHRIYVC